MLGGYKGVGGSSFVVFITSHFYFMQFPLISQQNMIRQKNIAGE